MRGLILTLLFTCDVVSSAGPNDDAKQGEKCALQSKDHLSKFYPKINLLHVPDYFNETEQILEIKGPCNFYDSKSSCCTAKFSNDMSQLFNRNSIRRLEIAKNKKMYENIVKEASDYIQQRQKDKVFSSEAAASLSTQFAKLDEIYTPLGTFLTTCVDKIYQFFMHANCELACNNAAANHIITTTGVTRFKISDVLLDRLYDACSPTQDLLKSSLRKLLYQNQQNKQIVSNIIGIDKKIVSDPKTKKHVVTETGIVSSSVDSKAATVDIGDETLTAEEKEIQARTVEELNSISKELRKTSDSLEKWNKILLSKESLKNALVDVGLGGDLVSMEWEIWYPPNDISGKYKLDAIEKGKILEGLNFKGKVEKKGTGVKGLGTEERRKSEDKGTAKEKSGGKKESGSVSSVAGSVGTLGSVGSIADEMGGTGNRRTLDITGAQQIIMFEKSGHDFSMNIAWGDFKSDMERLPWKKIIMYGGGGLLCLVFVLWLLKVLCQKEEEFDEDDELFRNSFRDGEKKRRSTVRRSQKAMNDNDSGAEVHERRKLMGRRNDDELTDDAMD